MIIVIEILLVMFLWAKKSMPILMWVMSVILFQMSFEAGNERIYLEIIDDYPAEDCVKPRKFRFLYKKLNKLSDKGIPKEMYYCEMIKGYGFVIYTVLAFYMFFINEYLATLFGGIYIGFYSILSLLNGFVLKKKSFIARYKMLNKYNMRYLFLPHDEPSPSRIGNCQIVTETKRFNRTFVTVRVLETGETKERVLLQCEKKQDHDSIYEIYEICRVFYII